MDSIANTAGVSKQTVYSHFANKNALFGDCILGKIEEYGLDMQGFEVEQPLADALHEIGRRFLNLLGDDDVIAMYRLMIGDTSDHSSLARSFWEMGPEATIRRITQYIQANTSRGFSDVADSHQAASDFLLMVEDHYIKRRLMHHIGPLTDTEKNERVKQAVRKMRTLYDAKVSNEG